MMRLPRTADSCLAECAYRFCAAPSQFELPLLWLWLPSDPQAPHAQIYIGERGRHVFKLVFHGESVSAAYDEGANAAVAAAQAVAKFEEYKLEV